MFVSASGNYEGNNRRFPIQAAVDSTEGGDAYDPSTERALLVDDSRINISEARERIIEIDRRERIRERGRIDLGRMAVSSDSDDDVVIHTKKKK